MYIDVNNIRLHYQILGKGKSLILLNPNSEDTRIMLPIGKIFSKNFKVYIVDRRGCGKSTKNCALTYDESSKDLYEFIQKLNLDKPYVLGLSGGASVALFLATMYPDCISKLVLGSGVVRHSKMKYSPFSQLIRKLTFLKVVRKAEKFYQLNEEARELALEELSKITSPTLVVNGGEKDIVPIEEAEYIANNIKNSKLMILHKEGHCTYTRKKDWYLNVVEFLETEN